MNRTETILVERLGLERAERLAAIAGGTTVSVPAQLANAARLRAFLGDDLATLVVLHFGGLGRVYVPRMNRGSRVDAKVVLRLSRKGWSASRIARRLGCSERTVHKKRAQIRASQPRKDDLT